MSTGSIYTWGAFVGQYTYPITWNGVALTVECETQECDPDTVIPVRVLAGEIEITDIVDTNHGGLCQLIQDAHDNRYCTEPVWAQRESA